jgi:uncharacterized membrane protein
MTDANDYELKPPEPRPAPKAPAQPPATAAPGSEQAGAADAPPASATVTPEQAKEAAAAQEADIRQNKGLALLAYVGVLVVIPMVFGQHSKFARHHSNQGLILFILEMVAWVGCKILMLLGYPLLHLAAFVYLTSFIGGLIWLVFATLSLLGLLHVASDSFATLPVIGEYEVINVDRSED